MTDATDRQVIYGLLGRGPVFGALVPIDDLASAWRHLTPTQRQFMMLAYGSSSEEPTSYDLARAFGMSPHDADEQLIAIPRLMSQWARTSCFGLDAEAVLILRLAGVRSPRELMLPDFLNTSVLQRPEWRPDSFAILNTWMEVQGFGSLIPLLNEQRRRRLLGR